MRLYTETGELTNDIYNSNYMWLDSRKDAEIFENVYNSEKANYTQPGVYKYNSVSGEYDCIMEDVYICEKITKDRNKNK